MSEPVDRSPLTVRRTRQHHGQRPTASGQLILIGGLAPRHRNRVRDFCLRSNFPVYAEALSGLREDERLEHLLVRNERMLSRGNFDCVTRIGNVPALRFWRDLDCAVTHYSDLPFAGMTRGEVRPIEELKIGRAEASPYTEFFNADREKFEQLQKI